MTSRSWHGPVDLLSSPLLPLFSPLSPPSLAPSVFSRVPANDQPLSLFDEDGGSTYRGYSTASTSERAGQGYQRRQQARRATRSDDQGQAHHQPSFLLLLLSSFERRRPDGCYGYSHLSYHHHQTFHHDPFLPYEPSSSQTGRQRDELPRSTFSYDFKHAPKLQLSRKEVEPLFLFLFLLLSQSSRQRERSPQDHRGARGEHRRSQQSDQRSSWRRRGGGGR